MKKLAIGLLFVLFSLALAQSGPIFIRPNENPTPINFVPKPNSPRVEIRSTALPFIVPLTIEDVGTPLGLLAPIIQEGELPPIVANKVAITSNCNEDELRLQLEPVFPGIEIKQSLGDFSDELILDESVPEEIRAGLERMSALYTLTFRGLDQTQTRNLSTSLKAASACILEVNLLPEVSVAAIIEPLFNDPYFDAGKICDGRATTNHNLVQAQFIEVFDKYFRNFLGKEPPKDPVKVAVVDTGIDYNHPDLIGGVDWGPDFSEGDNDPNDSHGHGTHVAGIIRATANNNEGIVGSAPMTKILAVKILDSKKQSTLEEGVMGVIKAIIWAANKGAKIINISSRGTGTFPPLGYAINYAVTKGSAVVVASGNEGIEVFHPYHPKGQVPANYHNVLTVGSINSQDQYSVFGNRSASNIGNAGFDNIKLVAYGGGLGDCASGPNSILSTKSAENIFNSYNLSYPDNQGRYLRMAGTSMATPLVSGAMALLLTAHPEWSGNQAQWAVIKTAVDVDQPGWDVKTGYGKLSVANAFEVFSGKNPPEMFITTPVEGAPLKTDQLANSLVEVTGTVNFGENTRWDLYFGQAGNWRKVAEGNKPVRNGPLAKLDIKGIRTDEVYLLKLVLYDEAGNRAYEYLSTVLFATPEDSPDSPRDLKAESKESAVQLSWQPPTSGQEVINYRVYRSTVAGGPYTALEDGLLNGNTPTYTDKNLEKNNVYYYVVSAIGKNGKEGRFSNEISSGVALQVAAVVLEEGIWSKILIFAYLFLGILVAGILLAVILKSRNTI